MSNCDRNYWYPDGYSYSAVLRCGWRTGVYDCRGLSYQHPWLAVSQELGEAVGCWSRAEARALVSEFRAAVPEQAATPE